jgi:hypothetical protein
MVSAIRLVFQTLNISGRTKKPEFISEKDVYAVIVKRKQQAFEPAIKLFMPVLPIEFHSVSGCHHSPPLVLLP